jgi:hypothetical protein
MARDADRVIIWDELNLAQVPSETLARIATALAAANPDHIIFVLGVWGQSTDQVILPETLGQAMLTVQKNGLKSLWITPASLITSGHWQTVTRSWVP